MLQRLPAALSHVKAGNTSEKLLNEACQIICSLIEYMWIKIENSITFKVKTKDYLELLKSETMILFGSMKNKLDKDMKAFHI